MFFVDPCLRVKTVCATDTHKQKNNLADGWQDLAGPSWQTITIEGCINIKKIIIRNLTFIILNLTEYTEKKEQRN